MTYTDIPQPTLNDLCHELAMLVGMIEGASVLYDEADGNPENPTARMAGNAMVPMLDHIATEAARISVALDRLNTPTVSTGE